MRKFFKVFNLLSIRLILLIVGLSVLIQFYYIYYHMEEHEGDLTNSVITSVDRASKLVLSSLVHSMMMNNVEHTQEIFDDIGRQKGIESIRIFNKTGDIMVSTAPEEVGLRLDMNAEACYVCHKAGEPLQSLKINERSRIFKPADSHRILGLITPIRNEPRCSNSQCHAHKFSDSILGILDVQLSLEDLDMAISQSRRGMVVSGIFMALALAFVTGLFIWFMVNIPINRLLDGTRQVSRGNLDFRLNPDSNDEIGSLARSFNQMSLSLKEARDEITDWSRMLENKVHVKTKELRNAQNRMLQIEKLASLGRLSATVAHELNNPLAGMYVQAKLLLKRMTKLKSTENNSEKMIEDIKTIADETRRCGEIVKNLLLFTSRTDGDVAVAHLKKEMDRSLRLIKHKLEMNNIELIQDYNLDDDLIVCDSGKLGQALLALVINAVEATADGGTLTVRLQSSTNDKEILISIIDSGIGIPEDKLPMIFEPYFSTKKTTDSIGLGLSVAYNIIKYHKGNITVNSVVGKGTEFIIKLPKMSIEDWAENEQTRYSETEERYE